MLYSTSLNLIVPEGIKMSFVMKEPIEIRSPSVKTGIKIKNEETPKAPIEISSWSAENLPRHIRVPIKAA